ncbi:hypothetical protein [Streptomyces chartreusis]
MAEAVGQFLTQLRPKTEPLTGTHTLVSRRDLLQQQLGEGSFAAVHSSQMLASGGLRGSAPQATLLCG